MKTMISPDFDSSYLDSPSIDKVIDVFESMVSGWYIEQAKNVRKNAHSDFAAIAIVTSLIEGLYKFKMGLQTLTTPPNI